MASRFQRRLGRSTSGICLKPWHCSAGLQHPSKHSDWSTEQLRAWQWATSAGPASNALSRRHQSPNQSSPTPAKQQWRGFSICRPDVERACQWILETAKAYTAKDASRNHCICSCQRKTGWLRATPSHSFFDVPVLQHLFHLDTTFLCITKKAGSSKAHFIKALTLFLILLLMIFIWSTKMKDDIFNRIFGINSLALDNSEQKLHCPSGSPTIKPSLKLRKAAPLLVVAGRVSRSIKRVRLHLSWRLLTERRCSGTYRYRSSQCDYLFWSTDVQQKTQLNRESGLDLRWGRRDAW